MNVAEMERFVSRADNDELDYYDGCDPYWAARLARRVIAAEKLVEAVSYFMNAYHSGKNLHGHADSVDDALRNINSDMDSI